ncbi:MAG: ChaN family lipoprotein [Thermodesulfobacteriota bacterium]
MCNPQCLIKAKLALCVFLLLIAGCSALQPQKEQLSVQSEDLVQGAILDEQGRSLHMAELRQSLAQAEFVLVGENHGNACDHQLQAKLLQVWAESGKGPVLGLEMVPAASQDILDEFNQGKISVPELESALKWEEIWGHDFSLYQPVLQAARDFGIRVFGLNMSQAALQELQDKGLRNMSEELRQELPTRIIFPVQEQKEHLRQEYQRHLEMLEDASGSMEDEERFFLVQSAWDSQMARQALEVREQTGQQVLILAGREHVRRDWGIVHRLRIMGDDPEVLTLVPWRGQGRIDAGQGDLFYYCPQLYQSRLGLVLRLEHEGMVVEEVQEDSRAHQAGFKSGDVLLEVGGNRINELMDLHQAARQALHGKEPLVFEVERQGQELLLELKLRQH